MMLDLEQATPPVAPLIDLAGTKLALKIDTSAEDDEFRRLIKAATEKLDGATGILGRCLVTQSWSLYGASFGELVQHTHDHRHGRRDHGQARYGQTWRGRAILLPLPPTIAVSAVTYMDAAGDDQTLDLADYWMTPGQHGEIRPKTGVAYPSTLRHPRAVKIVFSAGYGDDPAAATFPETLRRAALMLVAHWYRNKEAVVGVDARDSSTILPLGFPEFIRDYRLHKV